MARLTRRSSRSSSSRSPSLESNGIDKLQSLPPAQQLPYAISHLISCLDLVLDTTAHELNDLWKWISTRHDAANCLDDHLTTYGVTRAAVTSIISISENTALSKRLRGDCCRIHSCWKAYPWDLTAKPPTKLSKGFITDLVILAQSGCSKEDAETLLNKDLAKEPEVTLKGKVRDVQLASKHIKKVISIFSMFENLHSPSDFDTYAEHASPDTYAKVKSPLKKRSARAKPSGAKNIGAPEESQLLIGPSVAQTGASSSEKVNSSLRSNFGGSTVSISSEGSRPLKGTPNSPSQP